MASWSRNDVEVVSKYNFVSGLSVDQCLEEITFALDDHCPQRTSIFT